LVFVGLVGGIALLLRLVHVWQIRRAPFFSVLMGDARGYDAWAQQIAAGDWVGRDVFYQAPLYPYFLGIIYTVAGHTVLGVRLVQAIIGSLSCVLLGLAAWRLVSFRAGLIAGLGLAIYAPAIFFDGLMQKSVLDVFFICLSLWLLSRLIPPALPASATLSASPALTCAGLGLAMGGLSLTRENALLLVAVVAVWLAVGLGRPFSGRLRLAGIFVLAVVVVLVPVAFRNYAVGGGFYLTTSQFGPNFYIGNNPGADGTYASLRFGRGAPEYERQDATELAELAAGRTLSPSEVSSYWTNRALDFISGQPGAWLTLMGRKVLLLVNASEMLDTESQETYAEWSWPLAATGWFTHFGILVPLAVIGFFVVWPERRRMAVFIALLLVYSASVVMFYVFARYRFPLVPLLLLFAAAGLAAVPSWWRERASNQLVAAGGVLVLVTIAANWPTLSSTLMRAITENNLATALQGDNRLDDALVHYRRAIELQPDYAPAYNNMGTLLRAQGKPDQAVKTYQQALSVSQDYPDAHYNLANVLLAQGKPEEAAEHFQIALRSIPDSAGTRNNLGIALMDQGKVDEAIAAFEAALRAEPTSATTLRNLGSALSTRGRTAEAVAHLRRATEVSPGDEAAWYDLGSVLLEAGQFAPANDAFRKALSINPQSAEAHNNLGIALASQGRLSDAIPEFKAALGVKPDFQEAKRNLELALGAGSSVAR